MTRILTKSTKDTNNYFPETKIIGKVAMHTGNKRLYKVLDFVWHGDDDKWHILFEDSRGMKFTRTIQNFFGKRGAIDRFFFVDGEIIDTVIDREMED